MSTFRRRLMMGAMGGGDRSDLSMFDIYGNPVAQTTANCYVVSKPGTYKFPLVFGCALKNGAENPESYTSNGGTYSHYFWDCLGKSINTPYIESISGTVSTAQLSIADTDGVFTDISIIDGSPCRYVQFSVANVPVTGANGIVSIKSDIGAIMWSWHIWVWPDDLTPIEITNATGYKYNILPVNLASKWDDEAHTHIKNWFYQFGRPTPLLCPSAYNSIGNHASYGVLEFIVEDQAYSFSNGIQKPTTFFCGNTSNWYSVYGNKCLNIWDAACTSAGTNDNDVVKTVYDPCPVGFRMPNGNTFSSLNKTNVLGNFNNGYYFKRNADDTTGVFFPATGMRSYSDGSVLFAGDAGYNWASSSETTSTSHILILTASIANPFGTSYRSAGNSIRPVQE